MSRRGTARIVRPPPDFEGVVELPPRQQPVAFAEDWPAPRVTGAPPPRAAVRATPSQHPRATVSAAPG